VPHRDGDVDVASFAEIGWTYQVRVGFCSRDRELVRQLRRNVPSHVGGDVRLLEIHIQLDSAQELENGRVCVRSGIDESLDEMRRKYSGLDSFLVSDPPSRSAKEVCQSRASTMEAGQQGTDYFVEHTSDVFEGGRRAGKRPRMRSLGHRREPGRDETQVQRTRLFPSRAMSAAT
jgi:hypothetical protein